MQISDENDFTILRKHIDSYHKKFPMFRHDIVKIESIIEEHIKQYSIAMVYYRQSHKKHYQEIAQKEIDEINRVLEIIGKLELMAILSQA